MVLSLGENLVSACRIGDGSVLDVAPPMGALCLETWLGGSMLHFFGVRRGSSLIPRGAMYAVSGESKTVPFLGPTKSRHLPILCNGASMRGVQLEMLIDLWRCLATVETRRC